MITLEAGKGRKVIQHYYIIELKKPAKYIDIRWSNTQNTKEFVINLKYSLEVVNKFPVFTIMKTW